MTARITFDHERVSFNLAKLKRGGENFEVAIIPEKIISYKEKKDSKIPVEELIKSQEIFADVKKGLIAKKENLNQAFGTSDVLEVAKKIIDEGEIQFTQEYRDKLLIEKKNKIIDTIHKKGVDPKTGLPHPTTRIQNAFDEAKIKIDYFKSAEEQIDEIVKKIRVVLPIRFEKLKVWLNIPNTYASRIYGLLSTYGDVLEQAWQNDGGLITTIEIPSGVQEEFFDKINSLSHGQIQSKKIED
ncbi:ribosome assembly factor SBDS [Candidatus Woesearchaeota archaeon]|nr:ribosome assembly factor SBDS [Candidatus Woesearchaeota archaeon]